MVKKKKNNKINVLVTGSNGQLGKSLKYFYKKNSFYKLIFKTKKQLNITKYLELKKCIEANNIKIIINTAAYTNVDLAQKYSKIANSVNAVAVKKISDLCKIYDILLIHVSTDYVFDGLKKKPYTELDKCLPLSVYGESKLKGDKYIVQKLDKFIILRIAWLYGPFGNNFFSKVMYKFLDNKNYYMISNQYAYPASSIQLAKDILKLIPIILLNKYNKKYFGIFNYGPYQKKISRYMFVKKLSKLIIKNVSLVNKYKLKTNSIKNKFSKKNNNNQLEIRPKNSMLENISFFKTFKIKKQTFDNNLKLSLTIYLKNVIN